MPGGGEGKQGQIPGATCHLHLSMRRCPARAGLGPHKTPRDIREQVYRRSRDPVPREGGLVLPERRGEGSPGACSAWDVLLRYTRTAHQKPKGRHTSSPSTAAVEPTPLAVEPTPLGKLGWLLGPRWGFFHSQRAEGEAGLSRAAPFLEPQCHQAESFSARPAAPGCVPQAREGLWWPAGRVWGTEGVRSQRRRRRPACRAAAHLQSAPEETHAGPGA